MKVWVTRDKGVAGNCIVIWDIKPKLDGAYWEPPKRNGYYEWGKVSEELATEAFKRLFGFTPRKGSCKQYELTLKEIK